MTSTSPTTMEHRICHLNLAGGYRGGERQTELLVKELAARGWRQRLVVRNGNPLASRCAGVAELEIAEVFPHPIPAAIAARGCSVIHAHEARSVHSGLILRRLFNTPYLLTRRIDHASSRSYLRTWAYLSASRVIAISTSVARTVEARYSSIECPIVPDAHANLLNGHASFKDTLQRRNGKLVVGHIGELDHSHKGQGTIIEAARHVRNTNPDLRFVLVGDGKDNRELRRAARGLDNVEFVGFVDNVADYLASFDVFVYPSLREGLGSTLLDAMHFGLPIVASHVGGIPEIVEDQVNGLLIPPDSARDLVDALSRVISDTALRDDMARRNRAKAARYGASRMAASYESIYRSLL